MNRLDAIHDDRGRNPGPTLASSTYLGLATVVREDYPEPQVRLDLWGGTSGTYAGFDRFGRIVDHLWRDYGSSTDADRIQHGYDRASSRLWRANPVAAAQNPAVHLDELYQYDGVSQLVDFQRGQLNANKDAVTTKTFAEDWSLDATGNWGAFRQDLDGNGWDLQQARQHNQANEVTSASSWATPAHDRAGNMTAVPKPASPADALTATFDAWNRMVKVEDGQNTVAEYAYTPDNRRAVKKTYTGGVLSETRHFYYTTAWQCIEERIASGGTIAANPDTQYVWGARYVDHLILRDRDTTANGTLNERLYALHDANFNVTALVNPSGTVLERYTYTAYGTVEVRDAALQPTGNPSAYAWPYTYTTRRLDAETGLMYYRNRMYHPGLGRFVSRDPIGYWAGDVNLYSYCHNWPTGATDAVGLVPTHLAGSRGDMIIEVGLIGDVALFVTFMNLTGSIITAPLSPGVPSGTLTMQALSRVLANWALQQFSVRGVNKVLRTQMTGITAANELTMVEVAAHMDVTVHVTIHECVAETERRWYTLGLWPHDTGRSIWIQYDDEVALTDILLARRDLKTIDQAGVGILVSDSSKMEEQLSNLRVTMIRRLENARHFSGLLHNALQEKYPGATILGLMP